jgi:hypothetical protein
VLNLIGHVGHEFMDDPNGSGLVWRQIRSVDRMKIEVTLFKDRSDALKQKAGFGELCWTSRESEKIRHINRKMDGLSVDGLIECTRDIVWPAAEQRTC